MLDWKKRIKMVVEITTRPRAAVVILGKEAEVDSITWDEVEDEVDIMIFDREVLVECVIAEIVVIQTEVILRKAAVEATIKDMTVDMEEEDREGQAIMIDHHKDFVEETMDHLQGIQMITHRVVDTIEEWEHRLSDVDHRCVWTDLQDTLMDLHQLVDITLVIDRVQDPHHLVMEVIVTIAVEEGTMRVGTLAVVGTIVADHDRCR